ncbi:heparan sulfate glucosamine 3-O-sulfotransferase 2-like [Saccoglossus kowalevskii]
MHYRIKDTFEESVLEYDRFENIDTNNDLIKIGMYAYHLARWVRYFPLSQIYLVDGGVFKTDPVKELKNLERFLQLPRYFKKEHFFLHPKTNLYCSAFPIKRCLDKRQKGLRHPDVSDKIVKRLRDFYRAYDNQLSMMFNRTFTWMDEDV